MIFNKENNVDENSKFSKINKYLMDELNQLISDKETNLKIINQLKGNIIKLKTEFSIYKENFNKNTIKLVYRSNKKEVIDANAKNNINNNNKIKLNNDTLEDNQLKNYINYNIDKYSIGYDYNKYFKTIPENKFTKTYNQINKFDVNYNGKEYLKENEKESSDKNKLNNNDIQRLNILLENSQNNQKYNEIIKQREMIVNSS